MHTIQWTIRVGNLPLIVKRCPRCGCERYENSGCFRVNANGTRLDVWLIFRCMACKSTWNMRVYERIDRMRLNQEEYAALQQNDEQLVRQIAFDRALLTNNHIAIDFSSADMYIEGDSIPTGEAADVTLYSEYDLCLSACFILAEKLGVSKSRIKKLEEAGLLHIDGGIKKRKVGFGFRFTIKDGWSADESPRR